MDIEDIIVSIERQIPVEAQIIYNVLNNKGCKVFFIGGALRDIVLNKFHDTNKKIKDWDIATTSRYELLDKSFNKMLKVSERGKIVSKVGRVELLIPSIETTAVSINRKRFEVTPLNAREKDNIIFTEDIYEDLCGRDFTINSMAYNKEIGLIYKYKNGEGKDIDCFEDILNKVIRCTSDPCLSIEKNYFIMLRAIRFAISLNFQIEENTFNAIKEKAPNVSLINKGKVSKEFEKIILCNDFSNIDYLFDSGVINALYSKWNNEYNKEMKELFLLLENEEHNTFKRFKFLYDNFSNKSEIEEFLKAIGVKKDTLLRIKEIYNKRF